MRILSDMSVFARGRPTAALADATGLAVLVLVTLLALG